MTTTARRFALVTAVATFVLLLVGGLVNPTGSSLACPDWPLCHGSAFPAMVGGVVVQSCLGGATVLLRLPPLVSSAHLALSMAFFAFLVALSVPRRVEVGPAIHRALAGAAVLVYLQIVLGAVVRHTHSALACVTELPGCFGRLCRPAPLSLPVLVVLQIGLGVWTVLSPKALVPVELHLAVGALLLAVVTTLAVATRVTATTLAVGPLLELIKPRIGAVALLTYVLLYTPMKRRSVHALLVGAIPGAMPPLLGWTAGAGSISAGGLAPSASSVDATISAPA